MREKEIKDLFIIIDSGINVFNADKGFKVESSQGSDGWLVFDQRAIRWYRDGLKYMLQIFPNFDSQERITSWTLYGAVYYDTATDRYLTPFSPATKVALNYIALNTLVLLRETHDFICKVKKEEIPHVVKFPNN